MLLAHDFNDPQINLTMEVFLRMLKDFFKDRLISVVVFGSIVFDDLAPGYGDLDFLAVIQDDPNEETIQDLIDLRKPLRSGAYGIYAHMIEGPFLPKRMLDPTKTGKTVCWGTSGERIWDRNRLGCIVHRQIHERGIVIYGEDTRPILPDPTLEQILNECRQASRDIHEHGQDVNPHSVDWLLLAARVLLWLREGRFASKSEAADWGVVHAKCDWKEHLPMAKKVRKNIELAELPEIQEWLSRLDIPIRQAAAEVEEAVSSVS